MCHAFVYRSVCRLYVVTQRFSKWCSDCRRRRSVQSASNPDLATLPKTLAKSIKDKSNVPATLRLPLSVIRKAAVVLLKCCHYL